MNENFRKFFARYGIGLTGGIACGKSEVAKFLVAEGYTVIDADLLARQVLTPESDALSEVVKLFGKQILSLDGSLNRPMLGKIIFGNVKKRQQLEAITHPLIKDRLEKTLLEKNLIDKPEFWFYEAALLIETENYKNFFQLWVVTCPPQEQLKRLMVRSGFSKEEAEKIIRSQKPLSEKEKLADVLIHNDGSLEELHQQIVAKLEKLKH